MIVTSLQEFCQYFIPNAPIISVDMGAQKVGIAISDMNRLMALPVEVVILPEEKRKIEYITNIVEKYKACGIVIGLPLNMDGTDSSQTKNVRDFAIKLSNFTDIAIYMQDERMTSAAANSLLKSIGMNRKERHKIDDQVAACMILESVIENLKNLLR